MSISSSIMGYANEDTPPELMVIKGCGSHYVIASKVCLAIDMALVDIEIYFPEIGIDLRSDSASSSKLKYNTKVATYPISIIRSAKFPYITYGSDGTVTTSMSKLFVSIAKSANVFNNFGPQYDSVDKMMKRAISLGVNPNTIKFAIPSALSDQPFTIATIGDFMATLERIRTYAREFEVFAEKLFEMTKK